jgi:hypothetical protein
MYIYILDSRSFPSADAGSDRQLVMCKMRLKLKSSYRSKPSGYKARKHDLSKLKDQTVLSMYQLELSDKLVRNTADINQTLDQAAEAYSSIIKAAADNLLGFTRSRKKPWISSNTLDIVDKRREVKRLLSSTARLKPTKPIQSSCERSANWY